MKITKSVEKIVKSSFHCTLDWVSNSRAVYTEKYVNAMQTNNFDVNNLKQYYHQEDDDYEYMKVIIKSLHRCFKTIEYSN